MEVVVEHRPRITLGSRILQQGAKAVEKILFVLIVQEYPLADYPPCDYMVEGARCVDS